jgi:hypothetical protein
MFTDNLSRYGYMYLMKYKSELLERLKKFINEVKKNKNRKSIKIFQSDQGEEYLSQEF